MPAQILMPALSPTMTEGTLARWLVGEGDAVVAGDPVAEIETDKATMEVEAVDEGRLARILVPDGSEHVAVGTVLAIIADEGEEIGDIETAAPEPAPVAAQPAPVEPSPPAPPVQAPTAPMPTAKGARIFATPLARRLATERGVDLAQVAGSGPHGRIVKRDIEAFVPGAAPAAAVGEGLVPAAYEEIRLSTMRKTIARRLSESKRTIPHFYLTVDIELDELLGLRKKLNARGQAQGIKLSVNDFIIRAMALAIKRVPDANVQFAEDKLLRFARADISVAVAVPGGLVTPVIRAAETKTLTQTSAEMKALAEKARGGSLAPEDYQGGTISLSNLGMYGIKQFDAVINPPQAAILAVGAGTPRAVVKDGEIAIATVMTATLSCDHRAIDGATGAEYLAALKDLLEDPLALLL